MSFVDLLCSPLLSFATVCVPSFVALHRCLLCRPWLPFATPRSAFSLHFFLSLMPDYNQISGFLYISLHLSSPLSFLLLSLFLYLYPFLPLVVVSYSSLVLFSLLFVIPLLFFFIFLSFSLIPSLSIFLCSLLLSPVALSVSFKYEWTSTLL